MIKKLARERELGIDSNSDCILDKRNSFHLHAAKRLQRRRFESLSISEELDIERVHLGPINSLEIENQEGR